MALSAASAAPTTSGGAKNQALLITIKLDLVIGVSVQKQVRGGHDEVSINSLALRDLTCDALKSILAMLGIDGRRERGGTSYKRPEERGNRVQ